MSLDMWREEQGPRCTAGPESKDVGKWLRDIIVRNTEVGASTFRPGNFLPFPVSHPVHGRWTVLSQIPH